MNSNNNTIGIKKTVHLLLENIKVTSSIIALLSSAILAFGLYNVHALSGVTEGGILGLTLLLEHWFAISPALSGLILNLLCYVIGWRLLGRTFIIYSLIASVGFSISYGICEQFSPLWPQLVDMPFLAALIGALFVGLSVGVCVRIGGAPGGDDALAMSISHMTHLDIQWIYLFFDLVVLVLSITYIPLQRIMYSLLTVILSGQIIGLVQKIKFCNLKWKGK